MVDPHSFDNGFVAIPDDSEFVPDLYFSFPPLGVQALDNDLWRRFFNLDVRKRSDDGDVVTVDIVLENGFQFLISVVFKDAF